MDERDRDLLERMVAHAEAAIGYKRAGGRAWWTDPRTFEAIITRITQVGEAATKVSATTAAGIPRVPWVQIRNTRHRIVHDYMNADVQIVREIVTRELPALVRALTKALQPPAPARRPGATGARTTARRSPKGPR